MFGSVAIGLAGMAVGLILGLGLRAPDGVNGEAVVQAPAPAPAPAPAGRAELEQAELARAELASLRATVVAEQARLNDILVQRAAAEAAIARLRQDLAAAPSPPAVPVTPPPRPPRSEPPVASPPAGGQPRVFVHMRAGSSAAADAAASLAEQIRDSGFTLAELREVPGTPSQRVVRYFHAEDAAAAARLAGRLGRGWAIQDFRTFEPAPAPQTLEIWLPDR